MQRIVFENRNDEPFRTFRDGCVGTIRTIDSGGDKRVLEVKVIGQMDHTIDHTFESANRVYDVGGCSPTINTCGGGGLQPKILEESYIMDGKNFNQSGLVHTVDSICRTIIGQGHSGNEPKIIECKQLGFLDNGTGKHQSNTVYDENYISPSITTIQGGGTQQIKVLTDCNAVRMIRTEEGKKIRKDYENRIVKHGFNEHREMELRNDGVSNTISTVQKDNYICEKTIVAMRGRNPENPSDRTVGCPTEQRLEPNSQGICNTLTSVQKDNLVMEKADFCIGELQEHQTPRTDGISPSLTAAMGMGVGQTPLINQQYRIRKLTPLECWRLMDFTDEDFEKAAQVNSNTQLYKQAGNSICRNVLVAILGQMIPGKEEVYKKE